MRISTVYAFYALLCIFSLWTLEGIGYSRWITDFWLTSASDNALVTFFIISCVFYAGFFSAEQLCARFLNKESTNVKVVTFYYNDVCFSDYRLFYAGSFILIVLICFVVFVTGVDLYKRDFYSLSDGDASFKYVVVSALNLPIGLFPALLRLISDDKNFIVNCTRRGLLLLSILLLYSIGTKLAAILGVLYSFGFYFRTGSLRYRYLLNIMLVVFVLAMVLDQRSVEFYGLATLPVTLSNAINNSADFFSLALQVLASPVLITAETFFLAGGTSLTIELSPLSGLASGWIEIADSSRINFAIPFNTIGTLAAHSFLLLYLYSIILGLLVNLLSSKIARIDRRFSSAFVIMVSVFFCGMIGQYNLRSTTRWLYLLLLIWMLVEIFDVFFSKREKK
jgi:hypothetical protein